MSKRSTTLSAPMKKNQNYIGLIFVTLITLGVYAPVYCVKFVKKINILSENVFVKHTKGVLRFSPMLLLIPYVIVLACAIIIISACASLISVNVAALLIMLAPLLTVSGIVAIALAIHIMHAIANRLKLIAKQYERMDLFLLLEHSSFWWLDYNSFRAFNELTDEYNMRNNVGT